MEQSRLLREKEDNAKRVAARAFAQDYVADLIPNVFEILAEHGFYYDDVEKSVEKEVLPWLTRNVNDRLETVCCQLFMSNFSIYSALLF